MSDCLPYDPVSDGRSGACKVARSKERGEGALLFLSRGISVASYLCKLGLTAEQAAAASKALFPNTALVSAEAAAGDDATGGTVGIAGIF